MKNLDRRSLLAGLASAAALGLTAGCARDDDEKLSEGQVAVPLRSLRQGRRTTLIVAGNPVELVRSGDGVSGRSLRCTHTGCVVAWRETTREYLCPCHEGRFSEDGEVLAGPPPLPLRPVRVTIRKDRVIVG